MSCHGAHKQRLFIGEGGFKGVHALLEKHKESHPNLGKSIVATELDTFGWKENQCEECENIELYGESCKPSSISHDERCLRICSLKERGVTVILGFDGTQIHTRDETREKRFHRIHWNCPHDGSSYEKQTLPPIIKDFFSSASQVQEPGDRIHVTLAQPIDKSKFYRGYSESDFYQGYVYDIRGAAKSSGYRLYAKRRFDSSRYPGYEHEKTKKDWYVSKEPAAAAETLREFVFVKDPFAWPDGRPEHRVRSHPFFGQQREFYVRDTDEESSSYSLSDEPETDEPMDCGEDQNRKTPEPDPSPTDSDLRRRLEFSLATEKQ